MPMLLLPASQLASKATSWWQTATGAATGGLVVARQPVELQVAPVVVIDGDGSGDLAVVLD